MFLLLLQICMISRCRTHSEVYHSALTFFRSFACNDPQYGESFTAWDTLSNQVLLDIIEYGLVDGIVAYSPSLTNQSTFKTEEGEDITITVIDGATYVDASKITSPNYLTSNGVMHILDA